MFTLDLGFGNKTLYKGCEVKELDGGRTQLITPLDSTVTIIASNMLEIIETIPVSERDKLLLTGPVPPSIYLTAFSVLGPFFKEVEHFDGSKRTKVQIPQPPPGFAGYED
jgi:hypothetical protein